MSDNDRKGLFGGLVIMGTIIGVIGAAVVHGCAGSPRGTLGAQDFLVVGVIVGIVLSLILGYRE